MAKITQDNYEKCIKQKRPEDVEKGKIALAIFS